MDTESSGTSISSVSQKSHGPKIRSDHLDRGPWLCSGGSTRRERPPPTDDYKVVSPVRWTQTRDHNPSHSVLRYETKSPGPSVDSRDPGSGLDPGVVTVTSNFFEPVLFVVVRLRSLVPDQSQVGRRSFLRPPICVLGGQGRPKG